MAELNSTLVASIITFIVEYEFDKKEAIDALKMALDILKKFGYNKDGTPKEDIEEICLAEIVKRLGTH